MLRLPLVFGFYEIAGSAREGWLKRQSQRHSPSTLPRQDFVHVGHALGSTGEG